jgi:Fe-S-cluster containining protein
MSAFTDCSHQCASGCGEYESRPVGCRHYTCAWIDGWGDDRDRPDRLGLLFEVAPGPVGGLAVRGVETRPGGSDSDAAHAHLADWEALRARVSVLRYGDGSP